jgi:4-amino-4-deoxy-L-arabinose transferase-like glycosyltransferase
MSARGWLWCGVAVLLLASGLRLVAPGEVPPGLYHDEAFLGLDALDVLQGDLALYFPANNGREPIFIYLISLTVGLLGPSPFALRLASVPVGVLTVALTMAMGRALFSRRVGVLAAAVLAVTLWHVHLSRVGFRAVTLPLFAAAAIWQGLLAVRRGKIKHWIAAGASYGLCFYTYTAARFTPAVLVIFFVYLSVTRSRRENLRAAIRGPYLRGFVVAALAAAVVLAPLALYAVAHPGVVFGRLGQVGVYSPAIHGGDFWGTLGAHTLRTLGMFFVRGDRIWRHNVPWRPVFDPVLGVAFALGVLAALRRVRRDVAAGFGLIWIGVMAMPTLLAEDAPHFLRAVGLLPVVTVFPALGIDWLLNRVRGPRWRLVLVAFPLLFGLFSTTRVYFGDYARAAMTAYWFEDGAVALAGRVNGFLGEGWNGERMERGGFADRHVYLDPWLAAQWPQLQFLIAAPERVTVGLEGETTGSSVAVFTWPYEDWHEAWSLLPSPAEVVAEDGPLSQGDRDPEPYTTYLAVLGVPPDPTIPPLAR